MRPKLESSIIARLSKLIMHAYSQCSPQHIEHGKIWYDIANRTLVQSSVDLKIDLDVYAKVTGILSPLNRWESNLNDAFRLLFHLKFKEKNPLEITYTTTISNIKKAMRVYANEQDFVMTDTSMKTYSFYRNLLLDADYVTIDTWMLRAVDFERNIGKTLTPKRYRLFQRAIENCAEKLGLIPYQLQAIIWVWIRETYQPKNK